MWEANSDLLSLMFGVIGFVIELESLLRNRMLTMIENIENVCIAACTPVNVLSDHNKGIGLHYSLFELSLIITWNING